MCTRLSEEGQAVKTAAEWAEEVYEVAGYLPDLIAKLAALQSDAAKAQREADLDFTGTAACACRERVSREPLVTGEEER
jgi:hypothetical protein